MNKVSRNIAVALSLLGGVGTLGCGDSGPPTGVVKGVVKFDGQPYPNAIVTFTPTTEGPSGIGKSNDKGEYEIFTAGKKGAVLGKHKVSVITDYVPPPTQKPRSEIRSDDPEYMKQLSGTGSAAKNAGPPKEKIPEKYNRKTELSYEVSKGTNTIDLDLVN